MATIQDLTTDEIDEMYDEEESYEESSEDDDLMMSDVEQRIEEANCFKALLANPLFTNRNDISKRVENKVREFIKQELRYLLGIEQPKSSSINAVLPSQFSDEDVRVLKILIAKCTARENSKPTVNQVEMPKQSVPEPVKLTPAVEIKPARNVEIPSRRRKRTKSENAVEVLSINKEDQSDNTPKRRGRPKKHVTLSDGQTIEYTPDPGQTLPPPNTPGRLPMPSFDQQFLSAQDVALTSGKNLSIFEAAGVIPSTFTVDNNEE